MAKIAPQSIWGVLFFLLSIGLFSSLFSSSIYLRRIFLILNSVLWFWVSTLFLISNAASFVGPLCLCVSTLSAYLSVVAYRKILSNTVPFEYQKYHEYIETLRTVDEEEA